MLQSESYLTPHVAPMPYLNASTLVEVMIAVIASLKAQACVEGSPMVVYYGRPSTGRWHSLESLVSEVEQAIAWMSPASPPSELMQQ